MKFGATIVAASLASSAFGNAIAVTSNDVPQIEHIARDSSEEHDLWKRKGGGGGGGRGGGGSSSGGSRGGSSGGRGGGASSAPRGGVNGGRTVSGSGPQPRFGPGGGFYGGGARAPYKSGGVSPIGLIAPFALVGVAAYAFWPGTWYGGRVNSYRYRNEYSFFNETADEQQSKPVLCGCADETPCSCDEPEDRSERDAILDELIGNGSYAALNKSIVNVADYEGRSTILINGTLPYDTTLADADADSAAAGMQAMLEAMGWAPMFAAAIAAGLII
ncbi:hypothetical protein B0T11DRAFT_64511 [Plectosphaerella cucumerina]|uniref:DUF7732 domain-containing protein n=1 Tax=Plectosphaerella cucumerina TaxID=40658 RepID=A0A8K0TSB9_9PEZI|nr:hypothetical protein B0T11DRAFT_64511 [Plectosphaerella cucumerina]